ncbi:ATP-dependent DNA helicase UvrD2 [Naumannella halotolerans]|uniref:DNA 3'-5' helicase n=1 Tax=Naumannella halotolerans TaxID=993414 RepID=A0A4R7J894_9ACTN|nr:ATP-dependent DNA helicase UvrD2 [Naumannella halotolerans]TDT33701.1 DNA helicase-2/ATP-dependent DNA helicase PcrA [Naumannella halotolerans]
MSALSATAPIVVTVSVLQSALSAQPERLLADLDPDQREVATSLLGPVAVIAGAGTGKTRAITHRIAYGIVTGTYEPNAVLAVTFTTRAAGELRARLRRLGVPAVAARTFHSAALRQAQYFWPRVHGNELPPVQANRMSLVAEAASRLRISTDTAVLRDLAGEISWAKVSNVPAESYASMAGSMGREVSSVDHPTVARVMEAYEGAKRARAVIDFDDILLCTASLLADDPQVAAQVRGQYRHLVVDEYQDVSPLQEAVLKLWLGSANEICVVGDPAQTIHSFAGARADFLTGFARRHRDASVIRLVRDYRSTPQVVEAANQVLSRAPRTAGLQSGSLVAQRPAGPPVLYAGSSDEAAEAAAVADWLAGLRDAGTDPREMAVLFRINAQSPAYEQALADRGLPYVVRGSERFYDRAEVRRALQLIGAHLADDDRDPVEELTMVLQSAGWSVDPPAGAGAVRERWESLAALRSVAEDLRRADPEVTFGQVAGELARRAAEQHAPVAHGVTVATIHAAKGLEWDAVAVVGVQEGTLPFVLATSPAQVAEERRLFYVALTRAREHLRVSWSPGPRNRRPSRFLDGLRPAQEARTQSGRGARPGRRERSSVLAATCRSCDEPLSSAAERKLGRHTECPATYDEATLVRLRDWRRERAAEQKLPAYCVFTDATLVAIAEARPSDDAGLLRINGLGRSKLEKYGAEVLQILNSDDDQLLPGRNDADNLSE